MLPAGTSGLVRAIHVAVLYCHSLSSSLQLPLLTLWLLCDTNSTSVTAEILLLPQQAQKHKPAQHWILCLFTYQARDNLISHLAVHPWFYSGAFKILQM